VTHATTCIIKPISKTQEAAQREIEEAMKKVKEAQSLITAAVDEPRKSNYSPTPNERGYTVLSL
jgi:hypothetical protein